MRFRARLTREASDGWRAFESMIDQNEVIPDSAAHQTGVLIISLTSKLAPRLPGSLRKECIIKDAVDGRCGIYLSDASAVNHLHESLGFLLVEQIVQLSMRDCLCHDLRGGPRSLRVPVPMSAAFRPPVKGSSWQAHGLAPNAMARERNRAPLF